MTTQKKIFYKESFDETGINVETTVVISTLCSSSTCLPLHTPRAEHLQQHALNIHNIFMKMITIFMNDFNIIVNFHSSTIRN